MIAYKGFLPGLICRGYQFRMGLNVTEKANCAHNGFHCAEDPLDCLSYYGDINHAEYYLCLSVEKRPLLNDTTAQMRRTSDGWTLTAHGLIRYEDGTIEWNYSTGGRWSESK